jgi:hypothetical protein
MMNYALPRGLCNHAVDAGAVNAGRWPLNETVGKSDQEGSGEDPMKRFAVFAIIGPPLAVATLFLLLLPVAGLLEGVPMLRFLQAFESLSPVVPAYCFAVLAALVVALFDGVASLIEVPSRPIAAAIVGWLLAFLLLRDYLALPDLPGWFAAIGLLGAIPGFVCSWLTMKLANQASITA